MRTPLNRAFSAPCAIRSGTITDIFFILPYPSTKVMAGNTPHMTDIQIDICLLLKRFFSGPIIRYAIKPITVPGIPMIILIEAEPNTSIK